MIRFFLFILLIIPTLLFSQMTNYDVHKYVYNSGYKIFYDFENFYNVKIDRDLEIQSDDILLYTDDTTEIGKSIIEHDLIIISDNGNKYYGYSSIGLNYKIKKTLTPNDVFIRGVIIHEICHFYIYSVLDSLNISRKETYGFAFIQEGICEYSSYKMGELIIGDYYYMPTTIKDLNDDVDMKYEYSFHFVKPILDKYGFVLGTMLLLKTAPPTNDEILKPDTFYKKIKIL